MIADIKRYFAGEEVDFSQVAIELAGVEPFHRAVYGAARAVAWGHTSTYGDLAREAGAPREAREVGEAMSKNPVPPIIPCHRILAKGNKLGGFSAYGGTITKEKMLALEGVNLEGDAPTLPGILPPQARFGRA